MGRKTEARCEIFVLFKPVVTLENIVLVPPQSQRLIKIMHKPKERVAGGAWLQPSQAHLNSALLSFSPFMEQNQLTPLFPTDLSLLFPLGQHPKSRPLIYNSTDHTVPNTVSSLPPVQTHKMPSFLDHTMGGCQTQLTVNCFHVCSYSGSEGGEWRWVWGVRRQKPLKTRGQLCSSLTAEISYSNLFF